MSTDGERIRCAEGLTASAQWEWFGHDDEPEPTPLASLLGQLRRPAWHADAACKEHPELDWFPERGEPFEAVKAVCEACLVRVECLDQALVDGSDHGWWGGVAPVQRRKLRRGQTAA